MRNLGWVNAWDMYPEKPASIEARKIVQECRENKHKVKETSGFGRCVSEITCEVCQYTYSIDSSD